MAVVVKFFRWIWRKISCWILSWKNRTKLTIMEHPDSRKHVLKRMEKPPKMMEPFKMVETPKEMEKIDNPPRVSEPFMLAKTTDGMEVGHRGRSLLRLPQTAVRSMSTLMASALQTGWQMCSWKSSVSSTSVTSQMRTGSPLESPEAEMLREVYLVLWAIRKQLRQLARRQERRRRHHTRTHSGPQSELIQGLKQDTRSPL
ncbi:PREDICTED: uncharacterized protein C7orf61 homolog [Chrysochloris asiatica]|uniref:Uncharacterized protein C7orf61 homolog n=1 Tax=Chrysochloris asiatica TaxID=185453 RepID=A0A9B0T843_CHRAS|nr:PREDICTED: uncharacterized protein C7orf61 homolog [Chrysochloris asiatica]